MKHKSLQISLLFLLLTAFLGHACYWNFSSEDAPVEWVLDAESDLDEEGPRGESLKFQGGAPAPLAILPSEFQMAGPSSLQATDLALLPGEVAHTPPLYLLYQRLKIYC